MGAAVETLNLIELAQNGDAAARERLVAENTGLIWSVARKFAGRGTDVEDLFQIGAMGLVKCIDKFDKSFGVKFSTYAVPMILGEIKRYLRDDGMIKVSRTLKELAAKAKYTAARLSAETGAQPTIEELAAALCIDACDLVTALDATVDVESLSSVVNRSDGNPVYLIDKLDAQASSFETDPVEVIALKDMIARLPSQERRVIVLRYFKDKTQAEVAAIIGVSQVQVSRIEKRVLGAMRKEMVAGYTS